MGTFQVMCGNGKRSCETPVDVPDSLAVALFERKTQPSDLDIAHPAHFIFDKSKSGCNVYGCDQPRLSSENFFCGFHTQGCKALSMDDGHMCLIQCEGNYVVGGSLEYCFQHTYTHVVLPGDM